MTLRLSHASRFLAGLMLCGAALSASPAMALTAKECHAKFQSAKKAGTLSGMKYRQFKVSQCANVTTGAAQQNVPTTEKLAADDKATAEDTKAAGVVPAAPLAGVESKPGAVTSGNVTFPSAIPAQYARLSPGKARMKACLDQYHANKSTGGNGSLKWIQKGGGYYSQCNAKLK